MQYIDHIIRILPFLQIISWAATTLSKINLLFYEDCLVWRNKSFTDFDEPINFETIVYEAYEPKHF